MITQLLQPAVQQFILDHEQDDPQKLILKHRSLHDVPMSIIADQLIGRQKAKSKLPLYYNTANIVYPPGLNLEQSSSEKTALFKAKILSSFLSAEKTVADLTGGFGVDSLFFSKTFRKVSYTEPNAALLEIAKHNHQQRGTTNIEYYNITAEEFLKSVSSKPDCVFIDPSRRDKSNKKVFRLSDCEPNAPVLLRELFQKTDYVLIKTSPLLDIQLGSQELQNVEKIWILSVDNECKELLFLCNKSFSGEPLLISSNLQGNQPDFTFTSSAEKETLSKFSEPLTYLYEPNASILKGGAFKLVGTAFSLFKLHTSTHLYTSTKVVENFPGRVFNIISEVKPDHKSLMEIFPDGKANVMTRNYPLSPEELKKKTKLTDGGKLYLIGFSGENKKFLVAAERIQ
jgi:16S rRNA G966 N2-methylase RsmD